MASHAKVCRAEAREAAKADLQQADAKSKPYPHHSMSDITVTLPDGSSRVVPAGTTPADIAAAISPRLARAALAAVVDDRHGRSVVPARRGRHASGSSRRRAPRRCALYRHSTAHLLAAAVTKLFPGAQCGIGPATDEGFFYDFVVERPFVPEDLERIEKKMKELAAQDLPYERQMWPRDEAIAVLRGEAASR